MQASFSMRTRFWFFLYSTQNLWGSVLALIGLGMFFGNIIEDYWFAIVVGLYSVAWLAIPKSNNVSVSIRQEATLSDFISGLDDLVAQAKNKLPKEAMQRLSRIQELVKDIAPKLFESTVSIQNRVLITNTITRDLPETVQNYLQLPSAFANMHLVSDGKTCKVLLLEQLDILSDNLVKITDSMYRDDADALIANGKFLSEKFNVPTFAL